MIQPLSRYSKQHLQCYTTSQGAMYFEGVRNCDIDLCVSRPTANVGSVSAGQKLPPLRRLASPFTANKLLILAKLRHRDFAGLDSEFEQYHRAFEKNAAAELNEELAFDSFATDDSSVKDLIAVWIKERPNSYAAHMAMGSYCSWRGWHTRGPDLASRTPSEQFDAMQRFFAESVDDIKAALRIRSNLSMGYGVLIGEAR